MYVVDNGYGFEVRWHGRKVIEFATYDEANAFIKGE